MFHLLYFYFWSIKCFLRSRNSWNHPSVLKASQKPFYSFTVGVNDDARSHQPEFASAQFQSQPSTVNKSINKQRTPLSLFSFWPYATECFSSCVKTSIHSLRVQKEEATTTTTATATTTTTKKHRRRIRNTLRYRKWTIKPTWQLS